MARLVGKKLNNQTLISTIKEQSDQAPRNKKGCREGARKQENERKLEQEPKQDKPRPKFSFEDVKPLETGFVNRNSDDV